MTGGNIVSVGGIDLQSAYGLVLAEGYEIGIPEQKRYTVDLLGDGVIDLTEAMGDVFYSERAITLPMFVPGRMTRTEFEQWKSRFACSLHGRRVDISFAFDPGYTYTGRIRIATQPKLTGGTATITLVVDARPYKTKGVVEFTANAAGGVRLRLDNGRARTQPTVTVHNRAVLSFEGRDWELNPGTWTIEGFWLHEGENEVVVTTTPDYSRATLSDYSARTLQSVGGMILAELASGSSPIQVPMAIGEIASASLWSLEGRRLVDLAHPMASASSAYGNTNITFTYEWRDL